MSRRKNETDEEIEQRLRAEHQRNARQRDCGHYNSRPTEWHWSGQIREMACDDCGLVDFREEA